MTAENKRALLTVAAEIRKIIRQGRSNEYRLRSMADTIKQIVQEEKTNEPVHQKAKA